MYAYVINKRQYEDGDHQGEWRTYYENGQLTIIGKWNYGKRDGEWKKYHENGKLESIGKYKNGKTVGEWKLYDKNGKLIETKEFEIPEEKHSFYGF
ncbi:toxin-antitoxin system YwqK family antitoxin [Flavicella marina]|uniref:toxin-antitoxin system YwqK family antitoxin n=1 Tax=Flavicella marina TaxID=1475951 RepID=UPI0012658393|nr:hypothetical protein [Flavicella marina]